MKEEEKEAKRIIQLFRPLVTGINERGYYDEQLRVETSIKAALICVDEILKSSEKFVIVDASIRPIDLLDTKETKFLKSVRKIIEQY